MSLSIPDQTIAADAAAKNLGGLVEQSLYHKHILPNFQFAISSLDHSQAGIKATTITRREHLRLENALDPINEHTFAIGLDGAELIAGLIIFSRNDLIQTIIDEII